MIKLFKKIPFSNGAVDYSKTEIIELLDRWVIAHRQNISLSVKSGFLELSFDNSQTFTKRLDVTNSDKIINAYIFRNGNIMITTIDNKIFLTNKNFDFYTEKTVYKSDGVTPYPIHTPQNASFPGRYYYTHKYMSETSETDVYIFGNYCNVNNGGTPVILVYTKDFGVTWKIAYEFGQWYRDNGTGAGSTSTGTLLGNPNNTIVARHTHHVEFNPENNKWYCCTGDHVGSKNEIHWLIGDYNETNDSWNWEEINFNTTINGQMRLMSTEMFFHSGFIYWSTDATSISVGNDENGIWRSKWSTFQDVNTHEKVIDAFHYKDVYSNLKINEETGMLVFTVLTENTGDTDTIGIATNYGMGRVDYKTFPGAGFIRLNSPNSNGFFRLDYTRFQTLKNRTFLIKAGFNGFDEY